MSRRKEKVKLRLHLVVRGRSPHDQPVGVKALPPHLNEILWRWPGESMRELAKRACHAAGDAGTLKGDVTLTAEFLYADEVAH